MSLMREYPSGCDIVDLVDPAVATQQNTTQLAITGGYRFLIHALDL